ncbi:MAG: hypothetical protein GY719_38950 [bacterium]|nr:hypothetical protein [bacterium]
MTDLRKTDLPTSQKVDLAVLSLATQGDYGSITALSESFGVSRPTIYDVQQFTSDMLEEHFDSANAMGGVQHVVVVDEDQLRRAIVALRMEGPNALRPIENLIPILYPGLSVSYGKVQGILVEAEERARLFNGNVDLSAIIAGAVDEMYSQGAPVLAGVDLVSGYLFALALRVRAAAVRTGPMCFVPARSRAWSSRRSSRMRPWVSRRASARSIRRPNRGMTAFTPNTRWARSTSVWSAKPTAPSPRFLELFRAHHNLKTRRWGRHKGTSAHELVTGEEVEDWLTTLGFPPSSAVN